jgi:hypothetical protein
MVEMSIIMGGVALFLTTVAIGCAGIDPFVTIRKTFAPLSTKEFWFPPCPFCWAARAVALVAVGFFAASFLSA